MRLGQRGFNAEGVSSLEDGLNKEISFEDQHMLQIDHEEDSSKKDCSFIVF